jgi:uncharacterized alpha-E superfamily protein
MLSRVADSLYWMSRYVERAENVARIIDVNLNLMLDNPVGGEQQWQPLIDTLADHQAFSHRGTVADSDNTIRFLSFDPENGNSILSCIGAARENARSIREIISSEMWEQLNSFHLRLQDQAAQGTVGLETSLAFYAEVKQACHLFSGITGATMTRNEAWHFIELGRLIERADKTSRILDVKYYIPAGSAAEAVAGLDDIHWAAVLRSASAFEMYRKRHGRIQPDGIIEFLLLDADFPRSVRHCLDGARASLHHITGTPLGSFRNPSEKLLGQLCSDLAFTQVDEIEDAGLHDYLDGLQTKINLVGSGIYDTFFAFRTPTLSRRSRYNEAH